MTRTPFDPDQWYFGASDRVRRAIAESGVELNQYADDLEAVSFQLQPERRAEYQRLVNWLFAQRVHLA